MRSSSETRPRDLIWRAPFDVRGSFTASIFSLVPVFRGLTGLIQSAFESFFLAAKNTRGMFW